MLADHVAFKVSDHADFGSKMEAVSKGNKKNGASRSATIREVQYCIEHGLRKTNEKERDQKLKRLKMACLSNRYEVSILSGVLATPVSKTLDDNGEWAEALHEREK